MSSWLVTSALVVICATAFAWLPGCAVLRITSLLPPTLRRFLLGIDSSVSSGTKATMTTFRLNPGTLLRLTQGDLTQWRWTNPKMGAIVNAANERMLGGGGVDGAIHRRAGPALYDLCMQVPEVEHNVRCPTGEARITSGETGLPNDHVIHTVGPFYKNPSVSNPLLEAAYRNSLALANKHGLEAVAFPAISCGVFRFPINKAAEIAIRTSMEHAGSLKEIHFLLFGDDAWDAWVAACEDLLGDNIVDDE